MFEIGRVVYKIAGRDSNAVAVIIDVMDDKFVMIDGQTRRKKVNVAHIEPTQKTVDVKKNATHDVVVKALEAAGFPVEKKGAVKKAAARAKQQKAGSQKAAASASAPKAEAKAAKPKATKKE